MPIESEELRNLKMVPAAVSGIVNIEDFQVVLANIRTYQEQITSILNKDSSVDSAGSSNTSVATLFDDDFVSGLAWSSGSSGGSSDYGNSEVNKAYGVWLIDDQGSDSYIVSDGSVFLDDSVYELEFRLKLERASANPIAYIGLIDRVVTGAPLAACAKIDHASSGNWYLYTADGSGTTNKNTNIAVTYDAWFTLSMNLSRFGCDWFVDGRKLGRVDSNLPSVTTPLFFGVKTENTIAGFKVHLDRVVMRRRI